MDNYIEGILRGLDEQQEAAVKCVDGPVLIVAGAGSGKTRVLTSRIAYILAGGCAPHEIMALTFTKKAAGEMKERIAAMVGGGKARFLKMGTFHSVFIRFLREYAEVIGYPKEFTIYDTSDSVSAIKHCIKELGLDEKTYKPKEIHNRISLAKNNLITAEQYKQNGEILRQDSYSKRPRLCDVYLAYQRSLKNAGVMDFDDILMNMYLLLRDNKEARNEISSRFRYILVDEFQDTNQVQYDILRLLCVNHHNICVVGDDSQSIYAFRGAKIKNILNFKKDFPETKTFRLERNYRSTGNIVGAANSLIEKNTERIPKNCFSKADDGDKIRFIKGYDEMDEASKIVSAIIAKMQSQGAKYQDFAILYRTNAQSRALEEVLRKRNLPYIIYSGNAFFDRMEVKDMMAYFKLAVNPDDNESFRRIVNKPARGIGETSVNALATAATVKEMSLFRAAYEGDLENFGLRAAAVAKIRAFTDMILAAHNSMETTDAYTLAKRLSDQCGMVRLYKEENSIESQSRAANIEELLNSVKTHVDERHNEEVEDMIAEGKLDDGSEVNEADLSVVTLGDYLENISLLSAVDLEDEEAANNRIALMTVHSAKGLEFPYVFVTGMEENLFPSGGFLASPAEIEEERRLFYVALTRAERSVDISYAVSRMRNGRSESNSPSRFLREIDNKYLVVPIRSMDDDDSDGGYGFGRSGGYGAARTGGYGSGVSRSGGYGSGSSYGSGAGRSGGSAGGYGSGRSSGYSGSSRSGYSYGSSSPARSIGGSTPSRPSAPAKPSSSDADFIPVSPLSLKAGDRIEHNRFGLGNIVEISGSPADLKAKIRFDNYGEKVLLLKYAKIRYPQK